MSSNYYIFCLIKVLAMPTYLYKAVFELEYNNDSGGGGGVAATEMVYWHVY